MKKQKSKFLTFLFALIPGAAHMYMGFMIRGLSLMAAACGIAMTALFFNSVILSFLLPLIWIYAFFDAINLNTMLPQDFERQTDEPFYLYLSGGKHPNIPYTMKHKSALGIILVIIGALVLIRNLLSISYDFLPDPVYYFIMNLVDETPRLLIAVAIILIGVRMITGKHKEMSETSAENSFAQAPTDALTESSDEK